jgi:hypothetical protein
VKKANSFTKSPAPSKGIFLNWHDKNSPKNKKVGKSVRRYVESPLKEKTNKEESHD